MQIRIWLLSISLYFSFIASSALSEDMNEQWYHLRRNILCVLILGPIVFPFPLTQRRFNFTHRSLLCWTREKGERVSCDRSALQCSLCDYWNGKEKGKGEKNANECTKANGSKLISFERVFYPTQDAEQKYIYKSAANKSCNTSLTTTRRQLDLINTRS